MKVAIVNHSGFCVGGTTTICLQYAKLGFDVFFRNYIRPNFHMFNFGNNVTIYSSVDELISLIHNYDRIITVDFWNENGAEKLVDDFITIRNSLPKLEICHVYCCRDIKYWKEFSNLCKEKRFEFYWIFSLNPNMQCSYSTVLDINAFVVPNVDWISESEKQKYVFSAGRIESIKGTLKYLKAIDSEFLSKSGDFTYLYEGMDFTFHKNNNGVSCSPKYLGLFDLNKHPKEPKPWIRFCKYGELPVHNKFNIYPTYDLDGLYDRWKYYYASICCVLGTDSDYIKSTSLLGNDNVIRDIKERNKIEKQSKYWNTSLEYTEMEKIVAGVPVLFSRAYSEIIGFTDERLIYDRFLDIPSKILNLKNCYEEVRNWQYLWLIKKLDIVNHNILKEFCS